MIYVFISAGGAPPPSFTYVLDENNNNTVAGFAFFKLRNAYSGNCIRVRRASDNTEQNIGFSGDWLDESAVASFCGASNGFIVTWYDQSGNGKDMTQSTTSLQPQIYNGSAVLKMNGTPAATFTSGQRLQNGTTWGSNAAGRYYAVLGDASTSLLGLLGSNLVNGSQYAGAWQSGSSSTTTNNNTGNSQTYYKNNGSVFSGTTRGQLYTYLAPNAGQIIAAVEDINLSVPTTWGIGYNNTEMKWQVLIHKDGKTDSMADVIADINSITGTY